MLYERNQLSELEYLKHRHDDNDSYYDFEKNILDKSLSPYLFENSVMSNFLKRLQPMVSIIFDHMNVVKNMKNYMVDKYYYKHSK